MSFRIINARKRLIKSILLDIIIFFSYSLFTKNILNYNLNFFLNINLIIWIFLSYLFGRYHDYKDINKSNIINNIIKTFLIVFLLTNIYFVSEKIFLGNSIQSTKVNFLLIFYSSFGLSSSLINLLMNIFGVKNLFEKKWLIMDDNDLLSLLKDDNIKSENLIKSKFSSVKNFNDIDPEDHLKIAGIILQKYKELNEEEEKKIIILKRLEIPVLNNFEWCEKYLQRIPPKIIKGELHRKKILYPRFNILEYRLKKIFEFVLSFFLLIISIPIISIASLLIYLEDRGTIFYSQIRRGLYGKNIRIYKLRTMRINAEKDGIQWSSNNDDRITKVGNFLRKTRIDEIPQLISVLNGEMSLIGPRPERPEIDNSLIKEIPGYENRYNVLPGISGWAQVNYPYGSSVKDSSNKLSYDLYYLRNFSLILDLIIFLKTIRVVLKDKYATSSLD